MRIRHLLLLLLLTPALGHAYVGPGIGMGVIASLMALGSAFFVMAYHFIVAPVRRWLGKDKQDGEAPENPDDRDKKENEPPGQPDAGRNDRP